MGKLGEEVVTVVLEVTGMLVAMIVVPMKATEGAGTLVSATAAGEAATVIIVGLSMLGCDLPGATEENT